MTRDFRNWLRTSSVLVTVAMASPIHAQTAEGEQAGLDEIIVTAQRRVETSQRAAVAIDVATPGDLERVGAATANGLNAVAPSLYVTRSGGASTSYFIRGVGNFTNNSYSDPAVAFSLNGVYLGRPTSTTGTFFDLERVEVLKGPQGTLYGRNATGGAINVLYQTPKIGEVSGYASASYGNYDSVDLEGALNLPIGTDGAVRISGKLADQDGFNQDGTFDEKGEALRGQMFAQLTPDLSMNIVADWSHTGGIGPGASYNGTLRFAPGTPASASAPASYVFSAAPASIGPRTGLYSPEAAAYRSSIVIGGGFINPGAPDRSYQDTTNWGVSSEIKADLGAAELTLIPAYRETDLDFASAGPGFRSFVVREQNRQFSFEARLAGSAGPVDWLLGGYHFDEDIAAGQTINQYFVQSIQAFDTGTTSNAAFGRLTLNVSHAFRLVGGLRYTQDRKYFDALVQTLVVPCTNAPPPGGRGCFGGPSMPTGLTLAEVAAQIPAAQLPFGFPTAPGPANARPYGSNGNILFYLPTLIDERITNSRTTYRLSAEYDIAPGSLLYASYETGYRSGGFSVTLGRESYAPEYIEAFTIGSKNRFFGNRLQVNLEAFQWNYRDQQISHFGFDINGNNSFFTENVGRSRIKGIDMDVQLKATPTTLLQASVQYLDSRASNFIYNTPRAATSLPPAVGCPFVNGTEAGRSVYVVDCSGRRGFNSPRWSINGAVEQRFPLGDLEVTFNASGRYRSNRITGFDYLPQMNSGRDIVLDASLSVGPDDNAWLLTAWVRDLTDEVVSSQTQYAGTPGNVITTTYLPPRTYGLRAKVNF